MKRNTQVGGSSYTITDRQSLSIADTRDRLLKELGLLGAKKVVISSNLELRLDGQLRSSQREPHDPGIAAYFVIKELPHCISCDTWDRVADNLSALARYVEAMRGQIRWGVGDVAMMFAGFKALPNAVVTPVAMTIDEAARFLASYGDESSHEILLIRDRYNAAYKKAAKILHPDANGGQSDTRWASLQEAAKLIEQHQGANQ